MQEAPEEGAGDPRDTGSVWRLVTGSVSPVTSSEDLCPSCGGLVCLALGVATYPVALVELGVCPCLC